MTEPQRIGQRLGNYRLTRFLGTGDFAEIYLGEHVHLRAEVAIKVLHTPLKQEDEQSFRAKIRRLTQLDHPHLVGVLDFGIEESVVYLVTSYASQGSLRERYPRGMQLSLEVVLSYVGPLASALQYAHDRGVIHRNLKPGKMVVDRSGAILLADMGMLGLVYDEREAVGTMAYMAPEQIQGKPQPASDQYALGIIVYEWLTGALPFSGPPKELIRQHLTALPPALREKNPQISQDVEQIVLRALAKDPHERFASVQEFSLALLRAVAVPPPPIDYSPAESPGSSPAYPPFPYADPPVSGRVGRPAVPDYPGMEPSGYGQVGTGALPTISNSPPETSFARPTRPARGRRITPAVPPLQPRKLAQEQLRFTAFHPQIAPVETWNTLLVYAYIESALQAVQADAARFKAQLGDDPFKADAWAAQALTRGTEITVMPLLPDVTFNPERITFTWTQDWHPAFFRFGVDRSWIGRVGSGDILIFAGPVVIAALRISLRFGAQNFQDNRVQAEVSASRYRKIFTSYSHADTPIVQALRHASQALGDESFLDVENLRSGQDWNAALLRAIDNADIFQLFWSKHSASSQYVAQEYHYALQHYKYEGFIRPVYWQKPMAPPPQELSHLHFAYYPMPGRRFSIFSMFKRA